MGEAEDEPAKRHGLGHSYRMRGKGKAFVPKLSIITLHFQFLITRTLFRLSSHSGVISERRNFREKYAAISGTEQVYIFSQITTFY